MKTVAKHVFVIPMLSWVALVMAMTAAGAQQPPVDSSSTVVEKTCTVAGSGSGCPADGHLEVFSRLDSAGLQQTPGVFTSVSAASFRTGPLAPELIAAGFGDNLAVATQIAVTIPLPTALGGTTVTVTDSAGVGRLAPLFFVSPGQINYLIPAGTALGQATVVVAVSGGTVATGTLTIASVAPGVFTTNATGDGVVAAIAVRVKSDGTQQVESIFQYDSVQAKYVPLAIDPGADTDQVFLLLFGTGFRNRSGLGQVTVRLGGITADVRYAGAQGSLVGLDQLNVLLPRILSGRGEVDVEVSVDGTDANVGTIAVGGPLVVPPPQITSLSPESGTVGQSYNLIITGQNLGGTTRVEFTPSAGITLGSPVVSATTVTSPLTIDSGASPGAHTVSVLSSIGRSNKKTFTVSAPAPHISSLSATSASQGQTIATFTVSGQNLAGVTSIQFAPATGIAVTNLLAGAASVTARLVIASDAPVGDRSVTVVSPAGTSNALTFTVSASAPHISDLSATSARRGQTLATFTVSGQNLAGVTSIQFAPAAGLTVSNLSADATSVTARVVIALDAALGDRSVTVVSPAGTSNALTFTVVEAPSPIPAISNVKLNTPTPSGSSATMSGSLNFTDGDGDIVYVAGGVGTAKLKFHFSNGFTTCTTTTYGSFMNKAGQTSGTINFSFTLHYSTSITGTFSVDVSLMDGAGHESNVVSVNMTSWYCQLLEPGFVPNRSGQPSAVISRRRELPA